MKKILFFLGLVSSIWYPVSGLVFAQEGDFQKGLALANTGQYQAAILELNKVIELNPEHTTAYLLLGICYTGTGEYDQAITALKKIEEILSKSEVLHYTLALLYEKKEKWQEASLSWQKFIALTQDKEMKEMARKHLKQIDAYLKE